MNGHQFHASSFEIASAGRPANSEQFNLVYRISGAAENLSAARARLAAAAATAQRRHVITNEAYYGGPGAEETIPDTTCRGDFNGLLTRNHYGCLILNSSHTLFIDVDVMAPTPKETTGANVESGGSGESCHDTLADLRVVLAAEKDNGFRIYQTAAGFRILATTHEFEPGSSPANHLMERVGADAAFVKLCRMQNNFRARLTPKPWRCGSLRPPNAFPRNSVRDQNRFGDWLSQYERASRSYATCRYLGKVGVNRINERVAPIVEFHDRQTRAQEALPLA